MTTSAAIRFSATLQTPAEPKAATWTFLVLPAAASAKLPTRSLVTVEGTLAGQHFQATLQPDGAGSQWLSASRKRWVLATASNSAITATPPPTRPILATPIWLLTMLPSNAPPPMPML